MKTNEIKTLLDKFYQGETSPQEEQTLLTYFAKDSISDELIDEKEIFLAFYREDEIEVPQHVEANLGRLIDRLADDHDKQVKPKATKRQWLYVAGIAASIMLLFTVGIRYMNIDTAPNIPQQAELKDTYTDPNEAYKEAEKALLLLASNFNKGVNQLSSLEEGVDRTHKILDEKLNKNK